ncbi:hypothetical protein [Endozoicomonas euniceicola]|uniref:Uncharacterized protein n=1 Tax=Endozoicomonas euniceicola TaxID=1234143 RepID=A0ABY6GWU3_9GAMM|nr:hypothetical protein [Endozoicomonas euniceicola]UYM17241.1 hypothetical protein NX720_04775 [Endozoicomonas euniceicola]
MGEFHHRKHSVFSYLVGLPEFLRQVRAKASTTLIVVDALFLQLLQRFGWHEVIESQGQAV